MGKKNFVNFPVSLKTIFALLFVLGAMAAPSCAGAVDLPLATASPLTGVVFDDPPLALPVQRNFQMAMLTASSELGRSCGKMEAYGWRMGQTEQRRVNQIFNTTVDHLRSMNYTVEAQAPTSVSHDITMFTADRVDHHFIFMWSAGELGLVMVLCEGSRPLHYHNATASTPSVQVFPPGQDILQSTLEMPPNNKARRASIANFTPVGDWVGGYICEQGYTGGTLQIAHLKGENFDGIFRFYPTPKNPYVPTGRYTVYGQYDRASQRILINPGKWLERPKNFYNTIMVGSFDPVEHTFSAYFQGINGCTSFEAKAATEDYEGLSSTTPKHVKKKHKKAVKKKAVPRAATVPITSGAQAAKGPTATPTTSEAAQPAVPVIPPSATSEPPPMAMPDAAPSSIVLPAPSPSASVPSSASQATQPPATAAPVSITPPSVVPASAVPSNVVPPDVAPPVAAPAQTAPPLQVAPPTPTAPPALTDPAPQTAPSPQIAPGQAPKPSGALEPRHSTKWIQLASSGQWFTPTVPQAQQPVYVNPIAPQVPLAQTAQPTSIAPQANITTPLAPSVPPAQTPPQPILYNENPPQVQPPETVPPAEIAPDALRFIPQSPPAPQAIMVPDNGGPHP